MTTPRYSLFLGNDRYLQVVEWKGELRVGMREWKGVIATKKGISLNLMQYKNLTDIIEDIKEARTKNQEYKYHLGNDVYVTVTQNNPCVDIRQFWKPHSDLVPTRKGLCLRPSEYEAFKTAVPDIDKQVPEMEYTTPCYMQEDHANQEGFLRCKTCNPDGYEQWR